MVNTVIMGCEYINNNNNNYVRIRIVNDLSSTTVNIIINGLINPNSLESSGIFGMEV
mgnify:CR=1 FL=1